jgi:hypothetical protein
MTLFDILLLAVAIMGLLTGLVVLASLRVGHVADESAQALARKLRKAERDVEQAAGSSAVDMTGDRM